VVSIKDIAKDCGVSIATVSKALNNHNDVSERTKIAIGESAKRLGYHPNSQARSLKTHKTYNIGVLYVDEAHSGLTHSFFSVVLNSFKAYAEKMGYDVTFISKQVGKLSMTYYEHCKYRNVDGAVLICVDFNDPEVQELLDSDVPLVAIDYSKKKQGNAILSDNSDGVKAVVEYAYAKGHRKIAYIYGDPSQVTDVRVNSFCGTVESLGLNPNADYIKQCKYHDPELTEKAVTELIEMENPPTCIICPDDFAALGAYNAARAKGLTIPDDISIIGYDGITITQVIKPRLTTFKQNAYLIGKRAAVLLGRAILKEDIHDDERVITVKGDLIPGETVLDIN
jgi:DNA-binding LacI/PurR family transcriptional regulator